MPRQPAGFIVSRSLVNETPLALRSTDCRQELDSLIYLLARYERWFGERAQTSHCETSLLRSARVHAGPLEQNRGYDSRRSAVAPSAGYPRGIEPDSPRTQHMPANPITAHDTRLDCWLCCLCGTPLP